MQKNELTFLQSELKHKVEVLTNHRDQIEKIDSEIVEMVNKQLLLSDLETFGKSRDELEALKEKLMQRTQEQLQEIIKKKQS